MGRWFCSLGDICQHLETFSVFTSREMLLASSGQRTRILLNIPTQRIPQSKISTVLRLRNPDLKQRNLCNWLSSIHEIEVLECKVGFILSHRTEQNYPLQQGIRTLHHKHKCLSFASDKICLKCLLYFNHKNYLAINLRCFENNLWMVVFCKKKYISLKRTIMRWK